MQLNAAKAYRSYQGLLGLFVKRGCFLHADFEISVDGGWGDQNGASFLEFLAVAKGGG